MTARDDRRGVGAGRFSASMTTPASRDHAFEVEDRLTPYEIDTLVQNAAAYPAGSRLDMVLDRDVDDLTIADLRVRLAPLGAHGISVTVRAAETLIMPGKRLVLVAEDDPDMRRLVATLLRMAGHRVVEASDGTEVLSHIGSAPIDVIVSDINMPGLSGLDLIAALREARRRTPVVLITAFGTDEMRTIAADLGAVAVLDKPFAPEDLRTAVAGVCAS